MDNKLYRIEVVTWDNLPSIDTTGMLYTNEGVAFVKLHPVKINAKPSQNKTSVWKLNKDGSATCQHCYRTIKNAWDYDSWYRYCPDCGCRMEDAYA